MIEAPAPGCGRRPAPSRRPIALALVLGLCLSGCGPKDPLDLKVESATEIDLALWRTHALDRLSHKQMADFDEAVQQIKFQIMATDSARGSEVAPLALQSMDGQTVRTVLRRGLSWELRTLESEREGHVRAMQNNAAYEPDPGDPETQGRKAELLESQRSVIEDEAADITRVTRRLDAAGLPSDLPPISALDMATPVTASADRPGAKAGP
jgi:hypothetical protein